LLFTVALSVLAVVAPAVALPLDDIDPLREDVLPSLVGEGLVSREAEPLPLIVDVAPGVVLLVVDGELGESEDDAVVPVLVLMPASEFGAEPLTLPLGFDGAL
jgi:hypothetical protein